MRMKKYSATTTNGNNMNIARIVLVVSRFFPVFKMHTPKFAWVYSRVKNNIYSLYPQLKIMKLNFIKDFAYIICARALHSVFPSVDYDY